MYSNADDPIYDFLRVKAHPLSTLFDAKSIVLIGASDRPGSVGQSIWNNLGGFSGELFAVNPNRATILGRPALKSVLDLPHAVDLAIFATPASTIPDEIRKCVQMGIPSGIIISAGFKEAGEKGLKLEQDIIAAMQNRMRVVGPNCLGIMNPKTGLNATFAQGIALPGNVAFLSQSGALCTAVLDWSLKEQFGFSGFVSTGSMTDIGWGNLIDYFGDDPNTSSIVIYMESVGDARSFLSAAREVSLQKPIIVIKAGRTATAAKAAASHTGTLTGSDAVLDAAFRRCGVMRVDEISDVFHMADLLAKQPLPKGPKLAVLTNAGGPGVLATDALVLGGGELATLSAATLDQLSAILPNAWSHGNPVDILGDADSNRYAESLKILSQDPNIDGLLVITTPQGMTNPSSVATALCSTPEDKPILASWMGGNSMAEGEKILSKARIPNFSFPDDAVRAFNYMWRYHKNLRAIYETPTLTKNEKPADARKNVGVLLEKIRASGRVLLTELESKQILKEYGFPVTPISVALSADEAVTVAQKMAFPVVLKVHSETITHKSDVGGVQLNLNSKEAVHEAFLSIKQNVTTHAGAEHFLGVTVQPMIKREGYELILGSSIDPQFGPVLLFGLGGELVEVFQDRSLALPPLNNNLAMRFMEETKIYRALKGVRGRPPVDLSALSSLLVRFSDLVVEHPEITEIDINPLLASSENLIALDGRIVLHPLEKKDLPRSAIRPYPAQYISSLTLKNGITIALRPIRPEDEPLLQSFHEKLSEKTVYQRYLQQLKLADRTAHERLSRICFNDYDRELALVAINSANEIVGIGRIRRVRGTLGAELTLTIRDDMHRNGLGRELVRTLLGIATTEKYEQVIARMLKENIAMKVICEELGFGLEQEASGQILAVKIL